MRKILFCISIINLCGCGFLPFDNTKPEWSQNYCDWLKDNKSIEDLKNEKNKICDKTF